MLTFSLIKRYFLFLVILFFLLPSYSHAQAFSRVDLLEIIATLEAQIDFLLNQGAVLPQTQEIDLQTIDNPNGFEQFPTLHIEDTYSAIYRINSNAQLHLIHGTNKIDHQHGDIWNTVLDTLGTETAVDYLSELRIFDTEDSPHAAFVHTLTSGDWALGINIGLVEFDDTHEEGGLQYSIIHEFGHLITYEDETLVSEFIHTYWNRSDHRNARTAQRLRAQEDIKHFWETLHNYTDRNNNKFVSVYAASDPLEDLAETFTAFIYNKKPTGDTLVDRKILFLYEDGELVRTRKDIRENLNLP